MCFRQKTIIQYFLHLCFFISYFLTPSNIIEPKLKSNVLEGPYEIYNDGGILIEKGQMKVKISGVPGGILYRSKKDGIITKYYDNGKIKEEVPFELGAKNGIAKNYDEKGNITQIVYKFGKIVK